MSEQLLQNRNSILSGIRDIRHLEMAIATAFGAGQTEKDDCRE
jgi:hypothetical protein